MVYACNKAFTRLIFFISFFILVTCIFPPRCIAYKHQAIPGFIIIKTISITATTTEKGASEEPLSITIPLKRVGRLFLLEANIDNEIGNFVFDSGASKLVLNRTYFRKNTIISDEEGGGVTGTTGRIDRAKVKRLQISSLSFENVMADVTDLGHIENRRGVKILGLFGLSLIKNFELVIDINHNELHLYRLDKNGNRLDTYEKQHVPDVREKISEYRNVLFVKGKIGGKELNFCLDTGAESNVLSSFCPKKAMNSVTILRRSELMAAGSQGGDVLYGAINDFVFADKKLTNMQTIITSMQNMSDAYGVEIDGMLGYDFFSLGEICINIIKKEIEICFTKSEKQ